MKVLQDIGLTKNQADIYLLLLKLGVVSVSKLAKHTRLHRSNLYDVLENLQKKGLVNSYNEEGVRFYRPSPPQRIIEHLDEKKEKIKNMLPALENIFANQGEASVEIYKAKSGFKSAMTEFFSKAKQDDEFIWIGVAPIFEKVLPMTILTFVKRCDALGLRERGIMQTGESIQYKLKKHEYRYMSKKHISPTMFMQHRNMVAICIPTSPLCTIIIHSKEIAQSYKSYFEFMWKFAKKNYSPR